MKIQIGISKAAVMAEIERKTNYTGRKRVGDEDAYDRIRTIDEDREELDNFFDEVRVELVSGLSGRITDESDDGECYNVEMEVDDSFRLMFKKVLEKALFNVFVYGILARWSRYVDAKEMESNAKLSADSIDSIRWLVTKKAFTREMF